MAVAAGPVEAHTDIPAGTAGRVLRVADTAEPGWHATLDGRPLEPGHRRRLGTGLQLPADGGRLDLTYDTPLTHTAWLWAQGFLALVVLVLALPGRRREVDDDLPEAERRRRAQPVRGRGPPRPPAARRRGRRRRRTTTARTRRHRTPG